MKLLNCLDCHDIVLLRGGSCRACVCGKSSGRYLEDGRKVEVSGPCRVLGIDNREYTLSLSATLRVARNGREVPNHWFVIPADSPYVTNIGSRKAEVAP